MLQCLSLVFVLEKLQAIMISIHTLNIILTTTRNCEDVATLFFVSDVSSLPCTWKVARQTGLFNWLDTVSFDVPTLLHTQPCEYCGLHYSQHFIETMKHFKKIFLGVLGFFAVLLVTDKYMSMPGAQKTPYTKIISPGIAAISDTVSKILHPQLMRATLPPALKFPLPHGIDILTTEKITITSDLNASEAEERFYKYVTTNDAVCNTSRRFGKAGDGGWDMCFVGLYKLNGPCTVYSFGINNDWSFDDSISKQFHCEVRAFDPSLKVGDHKHSSLVWFYKTGIGGSNKVLTKNGWKIRTLGTLLKDLHDDQKVIDILKIDVEYSEWDSFSVFAKENVLSHVKQLVFEIHTMDLRKKPSTPKDFEQYWRTLEMVRAAGFRQWKHHFNHYGTFTSKHTGKKLTCCYELYFINTNFINPGYSIENMIINAKESSSAQQDGEIGVKLLPPSNITINSDIQTVQEAESRFFKYITHLTAQCNPKIRLGNQADGGWEFCISKQFQPSNSCLVYSFGINNDWSFDDIISKNYDCKVHAFDPSMHKDDHQHSPLVWFYNLGLGGKDNVRQNGWKINTLGTIRKKLNHTETVIDFLKFDIEFSEWEALSAMESEGSLNKVKQLALEIHTTEVNQKKGSTVKDYIKFFNALVFLEKQGFLLWHSHNNPFGKRLSKSTNHWMSCCYELYYINKNYL